MDVLVTYGSKRGGTAELAEQVAEGIAEAGHTVEVRPAARVEGLQPWDAVVVGGALYAWMWTRDARQFVKRHARQLQYLPVWFFSSGPLDDSADHDEIPPTWPVRRMIDRVDARGHVTFGGRFEDPDRPELPHGDWRNFDAACDWGRELGGEMNELGPPDQPLPELEVPWERRGRAVLAALCLFVGLTALVGGLEMIAWPAGGPWFGLSPALLDGSPFSDLRVPGLLLAGLVGVSNFAAGVAVWRRHPWSEIGAFGAGGVLTIWIAVQMALLQTGHWLQWTYLLLGAVTMMVAFLLWVRVRGPAAEAGRRLSA